jgi:esterase
MNTTGTTGFAQSGGQRIFYRHFGSAGALPVVIVHGLSYFSFDWIDIASALARDREVVAMDMRGFGESDWAPDRDYSIASNARDIVALIDHFGWRTAVLMGHSMGGRHCTYCAAKHGERAAALVSIDFAPSIAPAGAARVAQIVGNTPDVFASIEEAMNYYSKDPHSPTGAKARARFEQYLRPVPGGLQVKRDPHFRDQFRRILETGQRPPPAVDMWAVLAEVSCPMLFVLGTRSDMFTPDIGGKVREVAPAATLVEIDATHNIGGEAPDELIAVIRQFLSSLRLNS